ncbi:GIY-YIG nuclease family protein [Agromyces humatus]|uniref:GIY-YIG domain-containing protein n=1 Tax=Agromyces humatus TaxID=279573 RepID=A0ABN2K7B0_9MICO|nr:GIY-YIG nuclease family protein [Agromyces humatus]
MAHMYILRCSDASYYVGSTRHLERRLEQHAAGAVRSYTSTRLPVELVYVEEYGRIDDAYAREKQVQGWSRRKREALISGETAKLARLSSRARRG